MIYYDITILSGNQVTKMTHLLEFCNSNMSANLYSQKLNYT